MCGEELSNFSQEHFDTSGGASSMGEQEQHNSFEPSVAEETSNERESSYDSNGQENGGDSECMNVAELSPAKSSVAEGPQIGQVSTTTESPLNLPTVSEDEQKSVSSELRVEEMVTETREAFSPSSNTVASKSNIMDVDVVGPTTTTDVVTESTPSQSSITDSCSDSDVLNSAHQDVTEDNHVVQFCDSDAVRTSVQVLSSDEVPSSSTNENHLIAQTSEPSQSVTINHSTDKTGDIIDTTAAVNKQHQTETVAMEDDSVADSDVSWASLEVHASKSLAVSSVSDTLSGDEVVTSPRNNDVNELPPDSIPSTETVTTLADSMEDKVLSPQKSPSPVAIAVDSTTGLLDRVEETEKNISDTDLKAVSLMADDGTSMESQQEDNFNERTDEQQMAVQSSSEEAIAVKSVENEVLPEDPHVPVISRQLPEDCAIPEQSSISVFSDSHEPADEGIPLESKEDVSKDEVGTSEDLSQASCQDANEALHEDMEELMDTSLETTTQPCEPVSASHEQVTTSHELATGSHELATGSHELTTGSHEHMDNTEATADEPMDVSHDQSPAIHELETVEAARTLIQSNEDTSAMVTSCSDQTTDVVTTLPVEHTSGSPDTTGLLQEEDNSGAHDSVSASSNVLHPMLPQDKDKTVSECSEPIVIPGRVGLVDYPGSPSDNSDENNASGDDDNKDDKTDPEALVAPPSPTPSNASTPSSASLSSLDELPPSPGATADNDEIPQPQVEVAESQSDHRPVGPLATLPKVSGSPDALVVSPKAIVGSPVAQVGLSEMETEPCDIKISSPAHLTESSQTQIGSPELQVRSPEIQSRSSEPQVKSPEPQARSPEPQIRSPEPQIRSPEVQTRTPEPQSRSPELQITESQQIMCSEPKVGSPESPCKSPEPQIESTEAQLASELPARSPEMKVESAVQIESEERPITEELQVTSSDSPGKHIALSETQVVPSEVHTVESSVISPEPQTTSTEPQTTSTETHSPVSKITPTELQVRSDSPEMESPEAHIGLPGQQSGACELQATSPDPHVTSSEPVSVLAEPLDEQSPQQSMSLERHPGLPEPQVKSPEMQTGSPEPQARSPEMQVGSLEPQARSPEMKVGSPKPQARSPKMQVGLPEPQVREMQVVSPEPQARSPEMKVGSPKPQASSPEMQVGVPEPQVREMQVISPEPQARLPEMQVGLPEPQARSPDMQVGSPDPQARSPEMQVRSPEPQARSPKMQVRSPEPQARSPEMQIGSPEPQARSLEMQERLPEPQARSTEMQVKSPEPQPRSPEMQVGSLEPQARSPEMQVGLPEPQERSPESQQIISPEPQVESSEMELSNPQVELPEHPRSPEMELPEQHSGVSELHTTSPKQQVISPEMHVESPEPHMGPSESQYELSEPQEDKSPARSPDMEIESHEPQVESYESQYESSENRQIKPPEPQARSPESQTKSPEPQVRSPKPQARSPEPQTRSPELQTRSPELQIRSPEPQARSPETQARSPEPQARSPENQTEEMQVEIQVTATEQPEPPSVTEVESTEMQKAKSPMLHLPLHETPTTLVATSPEQGTSGSLERPHSPLSPGSLIVEIGSPKVSTSVLSESPCVSKIQMDDVEEQTPAVMQIDQQLTEGRGPEITEDDLPHPVLFVAGVKERHGSTVSDTSEQHCHSEGSLHPLTVTGTDDAVMTSEQMIPVIPAEQMRDHDKELAAADTSPVRALSDPGVGQEQEASPMTESDLVCREDKETVSEQDKMAETLPDQTCEQTALEPVAEEEMNTSSDHQQDIENNDNQVVTKSESLEDPITTEESKDDIMSSVAENLETCEATSKNLSPSIGQVDSELPSPEIDLQGDENNSQVCEMDTDQTVESEGVNATEQVAPDLQDEQVAELSDEKPEINSEDVTPSVIVSSSIHRLDLMDEEISSSSKSVSSIDSDFEESLLHTGPLATAAITTTAVSDDIGLEERDVEKEITEVEGEPEFEGESHAEATCHSQEEQVVEQAAVTTVDAEATAAPLVEDLPDPATTQAAITELTETVQQETESPVGEMCRDPDTVLVTESADKTTSDVVTESTEAVTDVICETTIDQEPHKSIGDEPGETASIDDTHETAGDREPPIRDTGEDEAAGDTERCRTISEKEAPEVVGDRMSDNEAEAGMDTNETSGASHDNTAESYTALVYLQQQQMPISCDESTKVSSDFKEPSVSLEPSQPGLGDDNIVNATLDQDNWTTEKMENVSAIPESHVPINAPQPFLSGVAEYTSSSEDIVPVGVIQETLVSSHSSLVTTNTVVTTSADIETTSSATEELQVDVEGVTDDSMESAPGAPEASATPGGESDDSGDSSDSSSSDSDSDDNQSSSSSSSQEDQMESTIVTGIDVPSEPSQPDAAHDDAVTIVESETVKITNPISNTSDVDKQQQQEDDKEISEIIKPVIEVTPQEADRQETVADSLPQTTPVPPQEPTAQETEDTASKPVRKLRPRPIPADAAQTWDSLAPESKQLHSKNRSKQNTHDDSNTAPTTNVQVATSQMMSVGHYVEQCKNQHPQEFSSVVLQSCGITIPAVAQHESNSREEGLQGSPQAYSKNSQAISTTSVPVVSSVAVTMGNYLIMGGQKRQSVLEHSQDSSAAGGVEQIRVGNPAERNGSKSLQQLLTGDGMTSSPHDVNVGSAGESPSYKGPVKDKVHCLSYCVD